MQSTEDGSACDVHPLPQAMPVWLGLDGEPLDFDSVGPGLVRWGQW